MSEYTAEEYKEALKAIIDMSGEERKKAFGVSTLVAAYIKDFSVSEIVEKYRAYINMPKVGDYWERDGMWVVIRKVTEYNVHFYYCDNYAASQCYSCENFIRDFKKIPNKKSTYIKLFLSEINEARKE